VQPKLKVLQIEFSGYLREYFNREPGPL